MRYDDNTELAYSSGDTAVRSEFVDCNVDEGARDHFTKQGVIFR